MVRLEDQQVAATQVVFYVLQHTAQVGDKPDLYSLGTEGEAYRVDGVVRDGEGSDVHIADLKAAAGTEQFEFRHLRSLAVRVARGPRPSLMGRSGHKDRDAQLAC